MGHRQTEDAAKRGVTSGAILFDNMIFIENEIKKILLMYLNMKVDSSK